jgi:hypothetical protein
VFDAHLAEAPAQGIWDSGAARSFVSKHYVGQYGMVMQPCDSPVSLADGSSKSACGTTTIKVRIQKYRHTVTFMEMDMLPQFYFILGMDWSRSTQ